ncbi:glutamate-5-semialdehyde dehydrogenase [Alteribacillus sp. HJP-4]|uniref:glutamate-5-semialdehyde dehydrogenase n=1 Tax=Alteribacillus sp. HJP-4 TaxID=2775394 RepID=UPI0035CCD9C4
MSTITLTLEQQAKKAKAASALTGLLSTREKNEALLEMADQLEKDTDVILEKNQVDLRTGKDNDLSEALLDRLKLTEERIKGMADGFRQVASLSDPIGSKLSDWKRPNGLSISQVRVPLGVIGIIYEARPNVTADAAALCLKTGNAALLRGSSSAYHSNKAIVDSIHKALQTKQITEDAVQLVEDTSREAAAVMFTLNEYLDVLIPRGGAGLIQTVVKQSSIPVLETGVGNCHVFIDQSAQTEMAVSIAVNAKTQRPSVCNAAETILIHDAWLSKNGEKLINALLNHGVEIRGDEKLQALSSSVKPVTEADYSDEFLDLKVAMKTVDSTEDAVAHIKAYGTGHTEAIVTESEENKQFFFQHLDAAALYHNASTRFTDGFEFGFGAEIGISTQKLHARGPMGLEALTSSKYLVEGAGQIKE